MPTNPKYPLGNATLLPKPLPAKGKGPEAEPLTLPLLGSDSWTRTSDLVINSLEEVGLNSMRGETPS